MSDVVGSTEPSAAWRCGADQSVMVTAEDAPGVLRCPHCGHRTDAPGGGTLVDGFDVVPHQWGLRGDPHAWWAMREALSGVPTPATADEVRAAYVGALWQAAGVDVDTETAERVHREHLDHGGMSGGTIHVPWWREHGVPLLVQRAMQRRPLPAPTGPATPGPAATPTPKQSLIGTILVWAVVMAIPAALIGGGGWLLYQRAYGTHVQATVTGCGLSGGVTSGYRDDCTATWTIDGEVVVGPFTGGNGSSDVGKSVDATVRNGTAYSRSLALPIVLLVLGLPFLALPVSAVRSRRRRQTLVH